MSAKGFLFTNSSERVISTLVGYLYTNLQDILMKTAKMQWKAVKTAEKGHYYSAGSGAVRKLIETVWFLQEKIMQNNVQMVQMPIN